jgi:membrane protein
VHDFVPRLAGRAIREFLDDHCAQYAASIAYHVLFSIFPLAIVLTGVFGIVVRLTGTRADVVDAIVGYLPLSPSGDHSLRRLLEGATGSLSALGLLGLVGVVYAASGMMAAIRLALNEAWDVVEYRPFLKGKLVDVALVLAAAGFSSASLGVTVTARVLARAGARTVPVLGPGSVGWLLGALAPLLMTFALVLFLYRVVPSAEVKIADVWPGALLVASAFVLLENLFALYVEHFANYNAVYGSLGAVIAFMFFVYLASQTFLLGAEVASEWPRVREQLAHGEIEQGPPLSTQVKGLLGGLWMRQSASGREPGGRAGKRRGGPRHD